MKKITIPAAVTLRDRSTGEVAPKSTSFFTWATSAWFNDPRWQQPQANLARLMKIVNLFEEALPTDVISLEDADWVLLCEIVREPRAPQPQPMVCIQLESYGRAVLEAKDEKSAEKLLPR